MEAGVTGSALPAPANAESRGVVLHIEDEPAVRRAMAMLLGTEGYTVSSAANGPQAICRIAEGFRPDLLIVDFDLGDAMNGAEATEELRRVLGYAVPVIMLTGDPSSAEFPWITDAPVWLMHKPANPRLLLAAMPGLVQLSRSTRSLPGAATRRAGAAPPWAP